MAYFWQGFFKTIVFTKIYLFKKIFHTQNKGCTIILVMLWFDEKKYTQCMNVLDYWYYIANEKRYKGQIIHKWIRWRFISQGDLRLEFQEIPTNSLASCFLTFFINSWHIGDIVTIDNPVVNIFKNYFKNILLQFLPEVCSSKVT